MNCDYVRFFAANIYNAIYLGVRKQMNLRVSVAGLSRRRSDGFELKLPFGCVGVGGPGADERENLLFPFAEEKEHQSRLPGKSTGR